MLPIEEWDRLNPLYNKLFPNIPLPLPELASAAVAEDESGNILGFWFTQMVLHMEPAGIDPLDTEGVSMKQLRQTLHESLATCAGMEYYIYTATPKLDEFFRSQGFTPIGLAWSARVPEGDS